MELLSDSADAHSVAHYHCEIVAPLPAKMQPGCLQYSIFLDCGLKR